MDQLPDRVISNWLKPIRWGVRLVRQTLAKIKLGQKLKIGRNVNFGHRVRLKPPEFIDIGNDIYFGENFNLETNLVVGDKVLISANVAIVGNDHKFDVHGLDIIAAGRMPSSLVHICGDNLIGYGVVIVGNVKIGKGCIIGAGAVVVSDLPEFTVCAGVPAKAIRKRIH